MTRQMYSRALILLDYQRALCEDGVHARSPALVERVRERKVIQTARHVLEFARTRDWLVVHVRLAFEPTFKLRTNRSERFDSYPEGSAMIVGSPEAEFVDELAPAEGEPVVNKGCVDPFIGTALLTALAAEGIRDVVLGGVATNLVVESAARHASDSGLHVTVVEDMCASFADELHDFSMQKIMPLFATVRSAADITRGR